MKHLKLKQLIQMKHLKLKQLSSPQFQPKFPCARGVLGWVGFQPKFPCARVVLPVGWVTLFVLHLIPTWNKYLTQLRHPPTETSTPRRPLQFPRDRSTRPRPTHSARHPPTETSTATTMAASSSFSLFAPDSAPNFLTCFLFFPSSAGPTATLARARCWRRRNEPLWRVVRLAGLDDVSCPDLARLWSWSVGVGHGVCGRASQPARHPCRTHRRSAPGFTTKQTKRKQPNKPQR